MARSSILLKGAIIKEGRLERFLRCLKSVERPRRKCYLVVTDVVTMLLSIIIKRVLTLNRPQNKTYVRECYLEIWISPNNRLEYFKIVHCFLNVREIAANFVNIIISESCPGFCKFYEFF